MEPPRLEVCLFDNDSSTRSPSALLGVGTVDLAPFITSSVQPEDSRRDSRREVLLLEPGSGKSVASAVLGITFSSHHSRYAGESPPPTESPRIADTANVCSARFSEVRKLSTKGEIEASEAMFVYRV